VERIKHLDELTVRCELEQEFFTGDVEDLQRVKRKVEEALRDTLNVRTKVELIEKGTIARTEGKSKKVVDLRGAL
jgi:phenylacetate-CoA ligase